MGPAIGQSLPIAVGIALSPPPIMAVVVMLTGRRGRVNATTFVVTWYVAVGAVTLVAAMLTDAAQSDDGGTAPAWSGWLRILLGVLALTFAARQWRSRPRRGVPTAAPGWLASLDTFGVARSAGLALLLSLANPEDLLLALSGGSTIGAAASGDALARAVACVVFAAVATLGVAAPLLVAWGSGERSGPVLDDLRAWLVEHNAAIMVTMLTLIGAALIGDGLAVL